MTPTMNSQRPVPQWLHGFWEYYRRYTHTAAHAASAAALTAFGLLVFVDRLFVVLAIAAYVCPPLFLYYFGADAAQSPEQTKGTKDRVENRATSTGGNRTRARDEAVDDGDTDGDIDGFDGDTDGFDGDTDGRDGEEYRDLDSDGTDGDSDVDG